MKIYLARFNYNVYEGSYQTLSAHKTQEGAEEAVIKHKEFRKKEYQKYFNNLETEAQKFSFDWDKWMDWEVEETELMD